MRPSPPSSRCSNLNANPNLLARMHPSDAILAADLHRSAYKAWAPQARQSGRPAIHHLSRSPIALGRSLKGHEDQFRPPGRDGRYRLDEATFAVSRGNGRAAPTPALRPTTASRLKSTPSGPSAAPAAMPAHAPFQPLADVTCDQPRTWTADFGFTGFGSAADPTDRRHHR